MHSATAIEALKVRAFLMQQEGHKRRGSNTPSMPPEHHPYPEYVALLSAGIRVLAHINSGATLGELTKTPAYFDMLALEATHNVTG